ncbi:MAG: hypothetical protein JHC71_04960 [Blastococcus sp.]|nr:hypothetical protein [Blastococcus sp.]
MNPGDPRTAPPWVVRLQRSEAAAALFARLARRVPDRGDDPVLVAVDGVDGAGKTVFAGQLGAAIGATGRPVVRASVDDFHQPRAVRHRRGRDSPEGFWLDGFDLGALTRELLDPLRSGAPVRLRRHDLATDMARGALRGHRRTDGGPGRLPRGPVAPGDAPLRRGPAALPGRLLRP